MLTKLAKTALTAAAILAGASAANASVLTLSLTSNGTGTGPIEVISENGTSWTKVPPAVLKLPVTVTVGSTVLDLETYLIRQNGTTIGTWIDAVDGPGVKEVTHLLTGTTLLFTLEKQAIINLCNAKLNVGQGIHQEHSFWFDVPLKLYAHFYGSIANYTATGKVSVEVKCKAVSPPPPPVKIKINDIDLFLSTYSNTSTQPNSVIASSCKKGQIKVRLKASKAGPAKFKLWTKVGAAPMTSKEIEVEASWDGEGFKAEYVEWVSVDKTTQLQAKAEEMVGLGLNTPWKDLTLLCSGSGATISQDTSNYKATAVMALYDSDGKGSRCPRTGKIGFTFRSNYSKQINYRLTSNTGIDKSGTIQLTKSWSEWEGQVMVPFQVNKTIGMGVVLRHIQNGVATIVATKTREYKCKTPIVNTGSPDLGVPTLPDPNRPRADWKGSVTVADSSGPKTCPRKAQIVFSANRAQAGVFKYLISCSNGASFTGSATGISTGGVYKAFGTHTLNITKIRNIQCTLQEVKPNGARVTIAKSGHDFTCRTPIVNTGSGNLVHGTNPSSSADTAGKVKENAAKRRLDAAKKATSAKRKREAAVAKARKLKATKDRAMKAAIAKRKRDAAKQVAVKKAAAALRLRGMKALKAAAAKRAAAAALARRKATLRKRTAPSSTRIGTTTQRRVLRRR